MDYTPEPEFVIERAGRECYNSVDKMSREKVIELDTDKRVWRELRTFFTPPDSRLFRTNLIFTEYQPPDILVEVDVAEKSVVITSGKESKNYPLLKVWQDSRERFIDNLRVHGHWSVIEHASVTYLITCSRACSHQIVRHRIASYSQRSQRYVNESGFEYITPPTIEGNSQARQLFNEMMSRIQESYGALTALGIPKEDARFVLPNAAVTQLSLTMNFRALSEFFRNRLDQHAQWEIRMVANEMLRLIKPISPIVFHDFKVLDREAILQSVWL